MAMSSAVRRIAILLRRLDVVDWLVVAILATCFVSLGWNRAHKVQAQTKQKSVHKPECDPKDPLTFAGGGSDGYHQYSMTCSADGKIGYVENKEAEKDEANYESRKDDLVRAMTSRPLTDAEFSEVQKMGYLILVHPMQSYFEEQVRREFADMMAAQLEIRSETAAHEVRAQGVATKATYAEPFDETPQEWATYEWEPTPPICESNPNFGGMVSCEAVYLGPTLTEEKAFGCVDPRRILLSSEDGKKHCYSFYSLPATANPDAEK